MFGTFRLGGYGCIFFLNGMAWHMALLRFRSGGLWLGIWFLCNIVHLPHLRLEVQSRLEITSNLITRQSHPTTRFHITSASDRDSMFGPGLLILDSAP